MITCNQTVYSGPLLGQVTGVSNSTLQTQVNQIFEYYRDTSLLEERVYRFLVNHSLYQPGILTAFAVGFSDRTLGRQLPCGKTDEGLYQRGRLQQIGLLLGTGGEFFRGALVFPFKDTEGNVMAAYGQRITRWLRAGTGYHLYWSLGGNGLFNQVALIAHQDIILCKNPLEAMTLLCAGYSNVVATMGLRGFSSEQLDQLMACGTRRVTLAFDHSVEGDEAASLVAQALDAFGIECHRLILPQGMDVNTYRVTHDAEALRFLVNSSRPFQASVDQLMGGAHYA